MEIFWNIPWLDKAISGPFKTVIQKAIFITIPLTHNSPPNAAVSDSLHKDK